MDVTERSSVRMARDWDRAVGSTGSLISSWRSVGVRRFSMVNDEVGWRRVRVRSTRCTSMNHPEER